jgi:hypothetical protein
VQAAWKRLLQPQGGGKSFKLTCSLPVSWTTICIHQVVLAGLLFQMSVH